MDAQTDGGVADAATPDAAIDAMVADIDPLDAEMVADAAPPDAEARAMVIGALVLPGTPPTGRSP